MADVPLRTSRVRAKIAGLQLDEDPREAEDPDIEYAKSQVKAAIARYNGLLDKVENAHLEQDGAQAAFKYRYTIIKPAQKPRGPVKPKPAFVIPASLVAGLLLGIIATALIDLWSRKLVEPWQVEHALGIPLLGEVRGL
jgi:capsular polysaccharide biosynthesis protein